VLGFQVRELANLRLDFLDLPFDLRADLLELSLRLHAVDRRILQGLLRPPDLRAIAGLNLPKALQLSTDLVRGRNPRTPAARPEPRRIQLAIRFRAITTSRTPLAYVYFSVSRSASGGRSTFEKYGRSPSPWSRSFPSSRRTRMPSRGTPAISAVRKIAESVRITSTIGSRVRISSPSRAGRGVSCLDSRDRVVKP